MNKKIKFALSVITIIVLLGINFSYAISNSQNSFITVNKEEIQPNETLEVKFNLAKINYNNFKIVLNSNVNNDEIYSKNNINLKEESDAIVIEIDKEKMNLSQITICYVIPENTQENSKIQFVVKVTTQEESEIKEEITKTNKEKTVLEETKNVVILNTKNNEKVDNNDKSQNNDSTKSEEKDVQSDKNDKSSQDIEKNESSEKTDNKKTDDKDLEKNNISNEKNIDMSKTSTQKSKSSSSGKTTTNNSGSYSQSTQKTETAVYNGSNNNYLKTLQVNGVNFNTEFSKENTSYFVTLADTENLEVVAEAEDSTAKISIIGNNSLKDGTNKILISVTAQNGDIRYYRIFANCTFNQ